MCTIYFLRWWNMGNGITQNARQYPSFLIEGVFSSTSTTRARELYGAVFLSLSWVLQNQQTTSGEHHRVWKNTMQAWHDLAICFSDCDLHFALTLCPFLSIHCHFSGSFLSIPWCKPMFSGTQLLCCLFQLLKQWPGNTLLDELAVVPTPCLVSSGASHQVWLLLQKSQCLRIQTSWSASCPTSTTHAGPIRCFLVSDFAGCSQDMTAATPLHRGKLRK